MNMNRTIISGILLLAGCAGMAPAAGPEAEVVKAEEEFRLAKLNADIQALQQILAEEYYGTNQYGASRDKAGQLGLYRGGFRLTSLQQPTPEVRMAGDLAIVRRARPNPRKPLRAAKPRPARRPPNPPTPRKPARRAPRAKVPRSWN